MKKGRKGLKRVVVAMSGGVDSSTAAALLKEQGFEVIGASMKLWPEKLCGAYRRKSCCSLDDIEDARSVAHKLGIPFFVFDFSKEFGEIIAYFYREYSSGRTPNPCIVCNQQIKFGLLLKKALEIQADYVATGHYARVEYNRSRRRFALKEAKDKTKDQSYTLFGLTQRQLSHALFPLGRMLKKDVRMKSRRLGLKTHDKAESQDICFVRGKNYRKFLKERFGIKPKAGPIEDTCGKRLGTHNGLPFYTIGQRKGLGIAAGVPLYVIEIDAKGNKIIAGRKGRLKKKALIAEGANWVSIELPAGPIRAKARIRYNHPKSQAIVMPVSKDKVSVVFDRPQPAITPGQAVVFYGRDEVLGGGWIRQAK